MTTTPTHELRPHTLAELQAIVWQDNPRRHDLESIRDSVIRFGYVEPLAIDDTSGQLVAGHGVLATLLIAQEDGLDPPDRVTVQGTDWVVPVLHTRLAPGEAEAYTLSSVRTRELGTWDERKLIASLRDIQATTDLGLAGVGWSAQELDAMVAKLDGELPASFTELAPDAPPEGEGGGSKAVTCPHCGQSFVP